MSLAVQLAVEATLYYTLYSTYYYGHHYGRYAVAVVLLVQVRPCAPTSSRQLPRLVYYIDELPESGPHLENRPGHRKATYSTRACTTKRAILSGTLSPRTALG